MSDLVPHNARPAVANASPMPPLPAIFADLPPSLWGDKLRENAAMTVGLAAMMDWFAQAYPQKQCAICGRWIETRIHADHENGHGILDRFIARKLGISQRREP